MLCALVFLSLTLVYVHTWDSGALVHNGDSPLVQNIGLLCIVMGILGCASPLVSLVIFARVDCIVLTYYKHPLYVFSNKRNFSISERSDANQINRYASISPYFEHVFGLYTMVDLWYSCKGSIYAIPKFHGDLHRLITTRTILRVQQHFTQ